MFEIELDRQVVQAGDEILGWITVQGEDVESVEVAFQGEEILGANDISHSLVLPVADEKLKLDAKGDLTRHEFRLKVPDDAPPTYASRDIRCQYTVKASVKRGFWRRKMIRKLHVTVLPALPEGLIAMPEELEVEHDNLHLIARLDQRDALFRHQGRIRQTSDSPLLSIRFHRGIDLTGVQPPPRAESRHSRYRR